MRPLQLLTFAVAIVAGTFFLSMWLSRHHVPTHIILIICSALGAASAVIAAHITRRVARNRGFPK